MNREASLEVYRYLTGKEFEEDEWLQDVESNQLFFRIQEMVEQLHIRIQKPRKLTFYVEES